MLENMIVELMERIDNVNRDSIDDTNYSESHQRIKDNYSLFNSTVRTMKDCGLIDEDEYYLLRGYIYEKKCGYFDYLDVIFHLY